MKLILFIILLGAFISWVAFPMRFGFIGLTPTNIAIYAVGLSLLISEFSTGRFSKKKIPALGFAIFVFVGVILSVVYANYLGVVKVSLLDNARSAKQLVLEPIVLYVIAFLLVDSREQGLRYLLLLVIVLGALNSASVIGHKYGVPVFQASQYFIEEGEGRLTGFSGNPNKTAYLICVLFPFQYYFFQSRTALAIKIALVMIMLSEVYIILSTGSRGGLLVLVMVVISMAYKLRDRRVIYAVLLSIPVLVALIMTDASSFLHTMERVELLASGDVNQASAGRSVIWGALLSDYTNSGPGILFGNGFGASKFMGIYSEPHNFYLRVLIEFGLLGLGIFIYFIWYIVKFIKKLPHQDLDVLRHAVLLASYVVVIAWMFSSLRGIVGLMVITWGVALASLLVPARVVHN